MRTAFQVATIVGPLSVVWDDEVDGVDGRGRSGKGAVVQSWFAPLSRVAPADAGQLPLRSLTGDARMVAQCVARWSSGDADALDAVRVAQSGAAFRQRVWQALRAVRGGTVISYADLAARAGTGRAMRAAGTAMALNAVAPFVPCHRVVRSDGTIGNYAYGADLKCRLLEHEGVQLADG